MTDVKTKYTKTDLECIGRMIEKITDKKILENILNICLKDKNVRHNSSGKNGNETLLDLSTMSVASLNELLKYLEKYNKDTKIERKDLVYVPIQHDDDGLIDAKLNNVERRLIKNRNAQRKTTDDISELDMSIMNSKGTKTSSKGSKDEGKKKGKTTIIK